MCQLKWSCFKKINEDEQSLVHQLSKTGYINLIWYNISNYYWLLKKIMWAIKFSIEGKYSNKIKYVESITCNEDWNVHFQYFMHIYERKMKQNNFLIYARSHRWIGSFVSIIKSIISLRLFISFNRFIWIHKKNQFIESSKI